MRHSWGLRPARRCESLRGSRPRAHTRAVGACNARAKMSMSPRNDHMRRGLVTTTAMAMLPRTVATMPADAPASSLHHEFSLDSTMRSAGTFLGVDTGQFIGTRQIGCGPAGDSGHHRCERGAERGLLHSARQQPGQRCMNYHGESNVTLVWGHPRSRPFKGFLVRWFEWLNATWPHAEHRLVNNGRDAQPIWALLPCIYSPTCRRAPISSFSRLARCRTRTIPIAWRRSYGGSRASNRGRRSSS